MCYKFSTDTFNSTISRLALHSFIAGAFVPASIYGQLITGNDEEDRSNLSMVYAPNMRGLVDYYENNQSLARSKFHYLVQPRPAIRLMILTG